MDVKKVLEEMVTIASHAQTLDRAMTKAGYNDNPYFYIYGNALDAIYALIGECTNTFPESITYKVFKNNKLTDRDRVAILLEYFNLDKNRPAQT